METIAKQPESVQPTTPKQTLLAMETEQRLLFQTIATMENSGPVEYLSAILSLVDDFRESNDVIPGLVKIFETWVMKPENDVNENRLIIRDFTQHLAFLVDLRSLADVFEMQKELVNSRKL